MKVLWCLETWSIRPPRLVINNTFVWTCLVFHVYQYHNNLSRVLLKRVWLGTLSSCDPVGEYSTPEQVGSLHNLLKYLPVELKWCLTAELTSPAPVLSLELTRSRHGEKARQLGSLIWSYQWLYLKWITMTYCIEHGTLLMLSFSSMEFC